MKTVTHIYMHMTVTHVATAPGPQSFVSAQGGRRRHQNSIQSELKENRMLERMPVPEQTGSPARMREQNSS